MVTYAHLRYCDPQTLNAVIEQWASAVSKLGDAESYGADVNDSMQAGDWDGEAAATATQSTVRYKNQLTAAVTEATGIRGILDDALTLFTEAKSKLDDAIAEVEEHPHLKLSDRGTVSVDNSGMTGMNPDTAESIIEGLGPTIVDLNERIEQAVDDATEADEETAEALRFTAIDEDNPNAFNEFAPQNLLGATVMREYPSTPSEHDLVDASQKFEWFNPADKPVMMTQEEWDMLVATPWNAKPAFEIYQDADETSEGMYGGDGLRDGHSDAWRHGYWSARMTGEFGADWAEEFTTVHEGNPNNPPTENSMDLHNNAVGIRIAEDNPGASPEELSQLVDEAVRDGEMVVLDDNGTPDDPTDDRFLPSDHNVPDGEHESQPSY